MRYLCFFAALLMLPATAAAQQQAMGARRAVPRQAEQSEDRRGDRSQDRDTDRSHDRRADRRDQERGDRGDRRDASSDQRSNAPQPRQQNWSLPSIGLPPVMSNNKNPWWEQQQAPWWERQGQPSWERQQPHQPPWARDLKDAQDRRLGKTTGRRRNAPPAVVYVLPPYRYFPNYNSIYGFGVGPSTTYYEPPPPNVVSMYPQPAEPPAAEITTGFLSLEVEPRGLVQVFVDGLFIGSLADLGSEIELRLGARRIELRAPGYRTLVFDTEIVADRTIVYRGALEPVSGAPAAPPAAAPSPASPAPPAALAPPAAPSPRVIYVIPGCYMGNVAPKAADLRPGCDVNKVQKIEP